MRHLKYLFLTVFVFLILLTGCQSKRQPFVASEKGILNLNNWDFARDGVARLDGKWEFYWNRLLEPGDVFSKDVLTGYYNIPEYWTSYPSLRLPSKGYATYRLLIEMDGREHILGLSTPDIYTEYRLWVNGELVGSNMSVDNREPTYLCPEIYNIYINDKQLEIILQIKNERHIYAGVGQSILLGDATVIHAKQNLSVAIDFFLIVICFLAGFYHLLVYFLRKKKLESFYFSVLCLAVGLWTMFFNESLLMKAFPGLPFALASKTVTLTLPLCVISITLYTYALYAQDVSKFVVKLILAANIIYSLPVIICPPYFYLKLFIPYLLSVGVVCLYGIYLSVIIMIRKRPEYHYYDLGILILAFGSFIDVLNYIDFINTGYFHSYSLVIFILLQTILIGKRYVSAARNADILALDLRNSLNTIEDTKTAFLNAQIKPHFLYNTLNTIAQCCQEDPEEAEQLILYLAKYLRGTLNFENLGNAIPLKKELDLVSAYFYIEKARFQSIAIEYEVDETLENYPIPPMTLQPLVENAVKHGIRNNAVAGIVRIEIKRQGSVIKCCVKDNGIGMEEALLEEILIKPLNSTSIGLYNIHTRLLRLYGKGLSVRSSAGTGTSIYFEIPVQEA